MIKTITSNALLFILILISFVAIFPLFQVGFFPIHDNTQIARVYEMYSSLSSGLFPVRWVADLGYGYGYPIFSFYAPLAYYIGALFMFLGFSALVATKTMIGLAVVLAGVSMYFLTKELTDKWSAGVATVLYVYAPYHSVNLYVRGAVGELWAYVFIPLVFLGFLKVVRNPGYRSIGLAVGGLAGVVLSHNLTALMLVPFLFIFIIILLYKNPSKKAVLAAGVALVLAFLVSAWYWIPTIGEIQYTNVGSVIGGGSDYVDHFVCFSQLWSSQWGFAGSGPGCIDGFSFQLGKIHILLGLSAVLLSLFMLQKKQGAVLLASAGFILSIFLTTSISKPLWDTLSFMKYLQFPWRFLQLALFFLSLLGGLGIHVLIKNIIPKSLHKTLVPVMVLTLVVIITIFYSKLFNPQVYYPQYRDETNKHVLNWTISRISDEYMPPSFSRPRTEKDIPTYPVKASDDIAITVLEDSVSRLLLRTSSVKGGQIQINKAFFPAWKLTLDNKPLSSGEVDGLYNLQVPAGEHMLLMNFTQTPLEVTANGLSIIGIVILFIGIIRKKTLWQR